MGVIDTGLMSHCIFDCQYSNSGRLVFHKIGFLIGSGGMMTLLNLMTAIYWGQLSHCMVLQTNLAGYSCSNTSAYGAVCFFAVCLFLLQAGFTGAVYKFRGELISETGLYDDISSESTTFPAHEAMEGGVSYANNKFEGNQTSTTSADL